MADEATNRGAFLIQHHYCTTMDAPITARVCRALATAITRDSAAGRRVLGWPGEPTVDALPLRLVGGLHALHRAGADAGLTRVFRGEVVDEGEVAAILAQVLVAHDAALLPWLDGPPQTNEPGRSAALMMGLLQVARRFGQPIELLEIGSSAGLNLLIDRYRFDLGGTIVGPDASPVTIRPEWRGAAPAPEAVRFASVRGVDINPIDVRDPAAAQRLIAYSWVDVPERAARLEAAFAMFAADPPRLDAGDAAAWIEERLAEPQPRGVTRVLMHSVVWQYLGPERQARIRAAMLAAAQEADDERPLAWVRMEPNKQSAVQEVWVQAWPGAATPVRVAQTHAHGTWVAPTDPAETPSGGDFVEGGEGYWANEATRRLAGA
ncbi:DUF2332 domain-containing protein [Sphingomonas sp. Ag1]|uniref:DUF2332 domain-containing protein n=1 Tax=Sphingomonas sp. Ag1 TaxID=1642949 RepID=UPI0006213049|nr:DUF2332 domain-containing protein [Sphingomonas sp. Ag1]KKI18496.1 hypothetical protein XM50_11870 [Sphingomonas sp. Ag1]